MTVGVWVPRYAIRFWSFSWAVEIIQECFGAGGGDFCVIR